MFFYKINYLTLKMKLINVIMNLELGDNMIDYSRADNSKNHRNSFMKMIQSINNDIESLKMKYENIWNKLEIDRKLLAQSIEESIRILKELKIKTDKPLNQYSRDEVPGILFKIARDLDDTVVEQKDKIVENAKTIESRFKFIKTKSEELENLENKLSSYYVKEQDYDDEVVIDLASYKKKKDKQEDNLTLTQELDDLVKNTFNIKDEEEDYTRLKITKDFSLEELAQAYYGNKEYWSCIYYHPENLDFLSQLCNLYDMDIEIFKSTKKLLKGFEICFPKEIKIYESIPQSEKKVA